MTDAADTPVVASAATMADSSLDPYVSLQETVTLSSADWSSAADRAWIYGIVVGWPNDVLAELAVRHGWSDRQVARLRTLHRRWATGPTPAAPRHEDTRPPT